MSFRYRDGSQRNGVPVDEAVDAIVGWVARPANDPPTATAFAQLRAAGRSGATAADRSADRRLGDAGGAGAGAPDGDRRCPDGLERLWTPHRMAYIQGEGKPATPAPATAARSAGSRRCPTRTG